jgi:hypothetical protein
MSYYKTIFDTDVPLSISNINNLGSQYYEMYQDVYGHDHDTLYYNKSTSDLLYVHENNDGDDSGADALTIDGYSRAELITSIPQDLIVLYGAALSNLPVSWHLCDGTNGTRNLLNRYVICCASDGADVGTTGGANTYTPTGTLAIDNHTLIESEIPAHNHSYYNIYYIYGSPNIGYTFGTHYPAYIDSGTTKTSYATGGGQGHNHTGSFTGIAFDNRPKSKAVFYVQKLAA